MFFSVLSCSLLMFEFIVVHLCYIDISSGKSTGSHMQSVVCPTISDTDKLSYGFYEIMHAKWV